MEILIAHGGAGMRRRYPYHLGLFLVAMFLVAGCGGGPQPVVTAPERGAALTIEASSFKFEPNNIKAAAGDILALRIKNLSSSAHNFTLKDPTGKVIRNVSLPPEESVTVDVRLEMAGTYDFRCARGFHAGMGMRGRIEVTERR
jgi:plastocyanin